MPDEETILHALMQWVGHDVQARQRDLAMLLSYIRLPLLPPQVWKFTQVTKSSKLPLDINQFLFLLSNFILLRGFLLTGVYKIFSQKDISSLQLAIFMMLRENKYLKKKVQIIPKKSTDNS